MKIIDQTPFYKENGELSLIDRGRAIMQFGLGWFKEVEAERLVAGVLKKSLDKNFTLLINIIPAGLNARIPLILVGPTGVYVMTVTPKVGMYRARGDQWGTESGGSLKPESPNLLTRTERMARALLLYLQRLGYNDLPAVEAVLLCSDPATNVDSMRPVIRVIMRDTLERFAGSIAQARIVLNPESVFDIVNRLLTPPPPPKPVEPPAPEPVAASPAQPASAQNVPAFAVAGSTALPSAASVPPVRVASRPRSRARFTRTQILLLVGMALILCIVVVGLGIFIALNMNPPLIMLN